MVVVLAVDIDELPADLPHDGGRCRAAIDTAAALAILCDLPIEKQLAVALIARFQNGPDPQGGQIAKAGPDDRLFSAAAHKVAGGAVAQDGIDGIDQDGFAGTGLTGDGGHACGWRGADVPRLYFWDIKEKMARTSCHACDISDLRHLSYEPVKVLYNSTAWLYAGICGRKNRQYILFDADAFLQ